MWVIWASPLLIPRKIKATNTCALPSLQYYMWTTDWPINTLRDLYRLTKIINECHGKHKYELTQLLYLPSEDGGKGFMEIEALYKHTKIKATHDVNTSDDAHIKLVKCFEKKKEDRNLKSEFKDARRYAEELQLDCQFNEEATVISHADQITVISTKEPQNIREILRKTTKEKRRTEVMEQPWVVKYVNQHLKYPEIVPMSYQIFKSWKNIPDIVLSID